MLATAGWPAMVRNGSPIVSVLRFRSLHAPTFETTIAPLGFNRLPQRAGARN